MALAWQSATLTGWLGENRQGSLEEQQLLGSTDEGHATSKSWMDADHSDAEQQSSTVLRKRYCDDLAELESDCWAQEQQQARQQSHLLKRVCSGLTSTSCEAGSAAPCWAASEEQTHRSEPCSPGAACPSEASAPHCSAAADTPTRSSSAGAAAAAAADGAHAAYAAAVCGIHQEQPQQGKANTRASSSRSAAVKAAAAPQDSGPAASSRASSKRATRKPSDSASGSQTNKAGGCLRSSKVSKGGSGRSSGSSACKGPRVRLGGRLLSPEEAGKHLKEVAAAAQLAAAKAAAAKAAAAAAAAAAEEGYAAAAAASVPAVGTAEPGMLVRPSSPSLDAIAAAPTAVADNGIMLEAAVLAAGAGGSSTCSPMLVSSAHGASGCQQDAQPAAAAAGSGDHRHHQHHHQRQEVPACKLEPMAVDCAAVRQPDLHCSSSALQQQHAAAVAAMDALGVDVDEDDLDLSMLPDQLADQLPEDFVPTPHQSSGWPSLESTLGGLDMPAAAAAEAALIGSACSAAGCNADSLAAAVQEEEAAQQQQQQLGFTSSRFLMSGPYSAAPGSMACPSNSRAAAAGFHSMRSRDSSSTSLCETALLQRGSYNSSMSGSSLARSCSMPIRPSRARPDSVRLSGPSGLSCPAGPDASSLANSGSGCLSGLPGFASSSMPINMSCNSLTSMHGGCAAMPAHDAAVAAAQQEEDCVDAELQQLLAQWSPDDTPAAAAAAVSGALLPHQASSAPAGCGTFSQRLSFPQQQMSMPMQGEHADMSPAMGSTAALPSAVSGPSAGFVGFSGPQQAHPAQLAWKSAFAPAAPDASSSGALSVTVPISVPAAGSALSLQCGGAFATSCSSLQGTGTAPVQIAYPAGRQPRARKGKGSGSKASQQQAKQHHQQQQQLTMQLQVPASALPAAVPPGARVVLHLKPNQQQQLMAVVDRLVQQRLAQTYEAGYRAATQNISSSMGAGSMRPPLPVQQHPQGQMAAGFGSTQMAAGDDGSRSMSMGAPAGLLPSPGFEMQSQSAAAGAAAAAGTMIPQLMVAGAGGVRVSGGQQLPSGLPRPSPLVDDILPSMQDLLTDCCE